MVRAVANPQTTEREPQAPSALWPRSHQGLFLMRRAMVTPAVMRVRPAIMKPAWRYRSTIPLLDPLRNPDWRRASRLSVLPLYTPGLNFCVVEPWILQ